MVYRTIYLSQFCHDWNLLFLQNRCFRLKISLWCFKSFVINNNRSENGGFFHFRISCFVLFKTLFQNGLKFCCLVRQSSRLDNYAGKKDLKSVIKTYHRTLWIKGIWMTHWYKICPHDGIKTLIVISLLPILSWIRVDSFVVHQQIGSPAWVLIN